jgi:hypothetical protein
MEEGSRAFHLEMMDRFLRRGEALTQKILNGYLDGRVSLIRPTRDEIAGRIENITLIDGMVEVECELVSRRVYRCRKWQQLENHDGFIAVELVRGWRHIGHGIIEITGESGAKGIMTLYPKIIADQGIA